MGNVRQTNPNNAARRQQALSAWASVHNPDINASSSRRSWKGWQPKASPGSHAYGLFDRLRFWTSQNDGVYQNGELLRAWIPLALILGMGFVLRFVAIDQSLWLDEATTILHASRQSYADLIVQFAPTDFHPPLFYLVVKFWISLVGTGEVAVRLLSVGIGVASIGMVYVLTRRIASQPAALVAASLLAASPLHIYYSQEARMYVFETFLVLMSVYLLVRIREKASASLWILFTVVNAFVLYTDYIPGFIFVAMVVWLLLERATLSRRFFITFCISLGGSGLLFAPFLPIFFQQIAHGNMASNTLWSSVLGKVSLKSELLLITKFMIGRISFENKIVYGLLVTVGSGLYGFGLRLSLKRKSRDMLLIWLWLLVPITLGTIIALKLAIFDYFRFLFVLPALYIIVADGVCSLGEKKRIVLWLVLLVFQLSCLSIYVTNPRFHREDWRAAVAHIESHATLPAVTVFVNPDQADGYDYYSNGTVPYSGSFSQPSKPYQNIWLMRYVQDIFDPSDSARSMIEQLGYQKVREYDFNRVIVWEYQLP